MRRSSAIAPTRRVAVEARIGKAWMVVSMAPAVRRSVPRMYTSARVIANNTMTTMAHPSNAVLVSALDACGELRSQLDGVRLLANEVSSRRSPTFGCTHNRQAPSDLDDPTRAYSVSPLLSLPMQVASEAAASVQALQHAVRARLTTLMSDGEARVLALQSDLRVAKQRSDLARIAVLSTTKRAIGTMKRDVGAVKAQAAVRARFDEMHVSGGV